MSRSPPMSFPRSRSSSASRRLWSTPMSDRRCRAIMAGTSTDICLIVDGEATLAGDRKIGAHRVALNSLDIVSLGAGGGSIGRVDAGGILHVGPESAGAVPGPACYGRGGTAATVTDANLVLGYLDPGNFLGGERRLDPAPAERAVDRIAAALGIER